MDNSNVIYLCDELAKIVQQATLNQDQFESVYLQLSPAERRLYSLLTTYEQARSSEIRSLISVSNLAQTAERINAKLERHNDTRRIVSERRTTQDQYGFKSSESFWFIEGGEDEQGTQSTN